MTSFLKNMAILSLLLDYPEALADESWTLILAVHSRISSRFSFVGRIAAKTCADCGTWVHLRRI